MSRTARPRTTPSRPDAARTVRAADQAPTGAHDLAGGLPRPSTLLNLTIGPRLADLAMVRRTFVLATIAVPIVIYGLMPRLHLIRARISTRPLQPAD